MISQIIWTRLFLEAQGYSIDSNILEQDNKSAILLENNGIMSSSQTTRHIRIRYFFINDRVKAGDVEVRHCPTNLMIADFLTKPLQGSKFIEFRDAIMGITLINSFDPERVGAHIN